MSKGLFGVEREVVLNSIISDKSSLMMQKIESNNEHSDILTLNVNEYKIYEQGIVFFKKIMPQWFKKSLEGEIGIQLTVSFYYRGRGLYFISTLKKVQNGFALIVPPIVNKMDVETQEDENIVNATIFQTGSSGVLAYCKEKSNYLLFENRLWLNFLHDEALLAKDFLYRFANLELVYLGDVISRLISDQKLVFYIPEKKIPTRNFFPYPISIIQDNIEHLMLSSVNAEIQECSHTAYIPFCESPLDEVHSVFGLKARMVMVSPMEVLDSILMLPVCRFLIQDHVIDKKHRVGSAYLSILCITDTKIIFGFPLKENKIYNLKKNDNQQIFPLEQNQEYSLHLHIPCDKFKRKISVTISVGHVYKNEGRAVCALCSFVNLQEEDRRFLYEKFNKTKCT